MHTIYSMYRLNSLTKEHFNILVTIFRISHYMYVCNNNENCAKFARLPVQFLRYEGIKRLIR